MNEYKEVYLVMYRYHEDTVEQGIFSTLEKAQKFIDTYAFEWTIRKEYLEIVPMMLDCPNYEDLVYIYA